MQKKFVKLLNMFSLIKQGISFIISSPFILLILIIGAPFRIFSKLPPITRSVIHSPYSFCVETLEAIQSKIDFIFNVMAGVFILLSVFYIFHLIF